MATYKRSNPEHYDGTDSFKDEDDETITSDGSLGDWTVDVSSTGSAGITSRYQYHRKVMFLTRAAGNPEEETYAYQAFTQASQMVVEAYIATANIAHKAYIAVAGPARIAGIAIRDSKWQYWDQVTGDWADIGGTPPTLANATWYHVAIAINSHGAAGEYDPYGDGNIADGDYRLYINGTDTGTDYTNANANDPSTVYLSTDDENNTACYFDAIGVTSEGYSVGDNLLFVVDVSMSTSNVYSSTLKGRVMDYKTAKMIIDEDEELEKGSIVQITDTYSVGGATASAVIFEGMVTLKSTSYPYELMLESLAKEDLNNKPAIGAQESGRTDQIITAQTADINHVADGTHENGEAMGTLTFGGTKTYKQIWTNLAKMDGSIWYLWWDAGTLKINYNDYDTDTGVDIDQSDNIKLLDAGRPARRYTKIYVLGLDGASGSASASATDLSNYGTNTYPHVDRTLDSTLCGTCATNLLAVLNQDNYLIRIKYSISGVGYIQEGQTITFAYAEEGSETIDSAQFIVWQCEWDTVGQEGVLTLMKYPHYEWVDSQLIQENAEQIDINVSYQTTQHNRPVYPTLVFAEDGWTSGNDNAYYTVYGYTFGTTAKGNSFVRTYFILPSDYVAGEDVTLKVYWRAAAASEVVDYDIYNYYCSDGENYSEGDNPTGQWTGAAVAWSVNFESLTITGTNFAPLDSVQFLISMDDNSAAALIYMVGCCLVIPVNARD